jgi:hypothetical protein
MALVKLNKLFTTMIMTKLKRTHGLGLYNGLHSHFSTTNKPNPLAQN